MLDESFKEFVLDQLGALPEVRAKAMFGGYGLYQADRFFGILMDGRLYFKTDEQTRTAYVERRMGPSWSSGTFNVANWCYTRVATNRPGTRPALAVPQGTKDHLQYRTVL